MPYQPRRVVTGHNAQGLSFIVSDGPPDRGVYMATHGLRAREYWNTKGAPARIERSASERPEDGIIIAPPEKGTRIRVCDFEPEPEGMHAADRQAALADFENVGGAGAYQGGKDGAHPMMHRTETIDYGIVLEGEIYLVLDEEETLLKSGDIVIQVGTTHAWSNRSKDICRMAFVLVDGAFEDGLAG